MGLVDRRENIADGKSQKIQNHSFATDRLSSAQIAVDFENNGACVEKKRIGVTTSHFYSIGHATGLLPLWCAIAL